MKSSRSTKISRPNVTRRVPADASSGLFTASSVSVVPSGQFSITSFSGRSTAMRRGARAVQHVAHRMLALRDIHHAVGLRDADAADELAQRRRRHAAPPQPRQRRHARIVPAGHVPVAAPACVSTRFDSTV